MPFHRFPFGCQVASCAPSSPSADGPRRVFVLGAYPSALHVRWTPPAPYRPVRALPVDNEPTAFWAGDDEVARVEVWRQVVGWREAFGLVAPAGKHNGLSGAWVDGHVLAPLRATRSEAWLTDCLVTYRASEDAAQRLVDTYRPFAASVSLPQDDLAPHPSEGQIVAEAVRDHRHRLERELDAARPELVVTLGNAALRVFTCLVEVEGRAPAKLSIEGYGVRRRIQQGSRTIEWLPLAHPSSPPAYQAAHARWLTAG